MRQLYGQEYIVAKSDSIKKGFDHEASFDRCVAYLHTLPQIPGCPRYTGDRITLWTCFQRILIKNNAMLGAEKFMVGFQGMHFNAKKAL